MLQRAGILPGTLDLLKELMALPSLQDFYLVGGTALALQYGHRLSVDLDLFKDGAFDNDDLVLMIPGQVEEFGRRRFFLGLNVNGIKCDFVANTFPLVMPLLEIEGVRLAQPLEIAAMKLWAITRRGAKKDFWDMYFLLKEFSLIDMFDTFRKKYPNVEPMMAVRSLAYFAEAESDLDPVPVVSVGWDEVKAEIIAKLRKYQTEL